jgi:phosphate acetyltransferase
MSDLMDSLRELAKSASRRVLFPECTDPRVLAAARQFESEGLGTAVLLSQPDKAVDHLEVFSSNPNHAGWLDRCVEAYYRARRHKGISMDEARLAVVNSPLLKGALLVRLGFADAAVAGSIASTPDVVRAGIQGVGVAATSQLVSSFFQMQWQDRVFAYADCGVIPDPDPQQLAYIAVDTARSYQKLTGEKPYVAMLSFSTKGSAQHAHVDKMTTALSLAQALQPDLQIDGELQFDAAFVPEVAAVKAKGSPVAGHANVFIFPDLNAGNIAYKITQRVGGAMALGPLLQGLAKPWMDLSRGCSIQDIVDVGVIAAVLCTD